MNDIQIAVAELESRGWTQAALADELGVTVNAVQKWKAGDTYPRMAKAALTVMEALKDKQAPPGRRYPGGHYMQRRARGE
jgi:ribosome-binding protein aMBF1 (putative translation factor)